MIVVVVRNYDDIRSRYGLDFAWGPCGYWQGLERVLLNEQKIFNALVNLAGPMN